jgi:hypothetical protein
MCDPVSLLGFGLSAASGVAGFMGQQAQYEAQQKMYQQNQMNAERAYADTTRAISVQQEQEQASAAVKEQNNDLQTRAAQAQALAGAAAGGVQGLSVGEVLGDYGMQDARANSAIQQQTSWDMQQGQSEKVAAGDQQVGRINSVSPGTPPNLLAAGLQIGQSAISGMTNSMKLTQINGGQGYAGGIPFMPNNFGIHFGNFS